MKSKKSNKILSIMLSLALTLTMFPMMTGAAYAENDLGVSEPGVTTDAELRSAISNVSENGTVQLAGNIALTSALTVNNGKTFTLTGGSNKYSLTRGSGCAGTMLNVTSGNVTLSNITVNGNNGGADFLVKVGAANASPTLTLGSGAKIVNGTGGGILVGCNGNAGGYGTLNIQDGSEISGMTGCGTVKNGSASTNASGVLVMGTNTHFNMTGGTIENNNAASWGTLVFYNNKGNATAEISGGSITGNKNSKGGGAGAILVDTNGRLTLNGGSITKNETTAGEYGGVRLFADSSELYIGGYNDNEGSGNPLVVTENTVNGVESNIKLNGNKTIGRVTGRTLAAGSDIGVSLCSMPGKTGAKTKVVTSSVESELAYFHSDQPTKAGMVRGAGNDTAIYLSYDAREIVVSISLPTGLKLADGSGDLTQTVDGSGTNEFKSIVIEPTDRQATTFTNSTLTTLNSALGGGNLTASIKNGNLVIDLANGKTSKDINSVTIGTGSFNTASNYYNVYGGTSTVGETEDNNKMNARYDAESGKLTWDCNQTGKLAFYPTSGGVTEYTGFTRFYCRAYVRDNGAETELTKTSGNLDVGGGKNIHNETYCSQSTTSPYILIKSWLTDTTKQGTLWIKVMPCNISQTLNQNCYFWINAGEIEQIKATLVDFGSLPETGVSIEDKSLLKQYVNGNAAIQNVVLKPTSGYLLTERETTAINTALAGSGLTATLTNGDIEISGAPSRAVQINLKAILGNITPTTVQATVTASGGTREGSYASVGDAMSATSTSGATITANGSNLTPVTGGTLSSGVTLVTKAGTFTAKDGNATINMDSDGKVTLTSGALEVGKNESADGSVTGKSGKVITNTSESSVDGEKKITITADSENNMDTVTAVASGSKVKIGGENGAEYETAAENTSLTVDSIGKVTLTGGSVKLDKTATEGQAEEAVTIGTTTVKNTSAAGSSGATPQITVTAVTGDSEDKTGTIAIPQGGEATIGSAVIGNASTGGGEESVTVDVSKNEDNSDKLTVNIPAGGKVTIDGVTYAAGSGENDASLIVNPGTGKVTTITGTVSTTVPESSWNDEDFSYELKAGETLTVGGYTYTAGNDSQVTLTGRSSENPIVTLGTDSSRVTVKKKEQPAENAGVTYTAASANTKFAISANDTDATKIDLLDNGNESANSKVKLPGGATAYGTADGNDGADSITGIANGETVVTTDSTGKLILVSGSGSSTGSMTATVGGESKNFETTDSKKYTITISETTSTVEISELAVGSQAGTVAMEVGAASKITFTGAANAAFTLDSEADDTTGVTVPSGATVSGVDNKVIKGEAAAEGETATKVKIDSAGSLTLVAGKGSSTGDMKAAFDNKTYSFSKTSGGEDGAAGGYSVDATAKTLTVEGGVAVQDTDSKAKYTGQGDSSATFTMDADGSVTIEKDGVITGNDGTADVDSIIGVEASAGASKTKVKVGEDGKLTLVGGSGTSTGTMTATIAGVGDKNFAADENNKYTVDATAGRLVLDEAGSVNMGTRITLAGEANAEFAIGKTGSEGSAKTTLAVPAGAGVSAVAGENATATVKGVAKNAEAEPAEKETKVEIDSAGNLALVEGKAEVTGESTLKVPVKNGGNISYYVDITIPDGTTCAIDAGDGKVKVTEAGKSVTIDGITCTAGKADSVFSIDSVKLTNDGDRAMIPAGKYAAVTVGEASDAKIVNVSGGNIGKTTITRGEPISVNIAAAGDSFSVNGVEYKAKEGNTTYTIDKNGKVTLVGSGNGSSSAIIPSGGKVENTSADKNTGVEATTIATVKPTTSTTDGNKKSAITIDEQIGDKIVENSISNKSTEVVVDAQTSKTLTETAAGGSEEIALPEKTVQELSAKTEASVTIKSDATEIKLDKKAVDGLASQAGSDGYVRLIVETVKQEPKLHEVALKLVTSKGVVTDFKGGNVNVTVKLNDTLAASDLVCVYIDDYSIYHMVTGAKNTDGTYRFTTGHFSTYAIMARPEAERTIAEQTAKVKELAGKIQLKARSVKTKKGNIKVTLKITKGANSFKALEDMGYTLKYRFYRSTKKAASYKAKFETYKKPYTNTDAKKGVRYYYKARVLVYDGEGNLIAKTKLGKCWYATRIR